MKLPSGDRAFVDISKLRDYCLDTTHEEGKHKARVFASALGISADDANWLRDQILFAAANFECEIGRKTEFGQRHVIDFLVSAGSNKARVRTVWNIRPDETFPRLITCYVL